MKNEPCARFTKFIMPSTSVSPADIKNSATPNWSPFKSCVANCVTSSTLTRHDQRPLQKSFLRVRLRGHAFSDELPGALHGVVRVMGEFAAEALLFRRVEQPLAGKAAAGRIEPRGHGAFDQGNVDLGIAAGRNRVHHIRYVVDIDVVINANTILEPQHEGGGR